MKKKRSAEAFVFIFGGCAPLAIWSAWNCRMSSAVASSSKGMLRAAVFRCHCWSETLVDADAWTPTISAVRVPLAKHVPSLRDPTPRPSQPDGRSMMP